MLKTSKREYCRKDFNTMFNKLCIFVVSILCLSSAATIGNRRELLNVPGEVESKSTAIAKFSQVNPVSEEQDHEGSLEKKDPLDGIIENEVDDKQKLRKGKEEHYVIQPNITNQSPKNPPGIVPVTGSGIETYKEVAPQSKLTGIIPVTGNGSEKYEGNALKSTSKEGIYELEEEKDNESYTVQPNVTNQKTVTRSVKEADAFTMQGKASESASLIVLDEKDEQFPKIPPEDPNFIPKLLAIILGPVIFGAVAVALVLCYLCPKCPLHKHLHRKRNGYTFVDKKKAQRDEVQQEQQSVTDDPPTSGTNTPLVANPC